LFGLFLLITDLLITDYFFSECFDELGDAGAIDIQLAKGDGPLIGWDQLLDWPYLDHSFLSDGRVADEVGDNTDAESMFDGMNDRSQVWYNEFVTVLLDEDRRLVARTCGY